jgi:hypothetical protein
VQKAKKNKYNQNKDYIDKGKPQSRAKQGRKKV